MSYLVILHVRDINTVKAIAKKFNPESAVTAVAIYALPTKRDAVCPGFTGGCRKTSWTRDRHGRMIHSCGGRIKQWKERVRGSLFDLLGVNLLPNARTPNLFKNPEGWSKPAGQPTKKRPHSAE